MRVFPFLVLATLAAPAASQTLVVGNKAEHTLSFIDLSSGKEVARRATGRAPHEIVVSADGRTAIAVSYREKDYAGSTLHLFDVTRAKGAGTIELAGHRGLHGLKWIDARHVIATSEVTKNVAIVDTVTKKLVASIPTEQEGSHMVAVAPGGKRAFVSNIGSGTLTVIDLVKRAKLADLAVGGGAEAVAVSPDGRQVWVGSNEESKIVIFDAASLARIGDVATAGVPIRVEFAPNGKAVAVSDYRGAKVTILDAASRKTVATVDLAGSGLQAPVTMLFSPDGKHLWVAATGSEAVAEIDTKDWTLGRRFAVGKGADGLGYSRANSRPR